MASQEVFLLIDADRISPKVERAVRINDAEGIADLSQNIERGDRILRSWFEDRSGRILLFHGDEIYASCPGEALSDLGTLHEQLQEAWDDSITIGVGLDLNEAKKALDAGKKRGGARIVFYAPEIENMVGEESASESHDAKEETPDPGELKTLNKSNIPPPANERMAYENMAPANESIACPTCWDHNTKTNRRVQYGLFGAIINCLDCNADGKYQYHMNDEDKAWELRRIQTLKAHSAKQRAEDKGLKVIKAELSKSNTPEEMGIHAIKHASLQNDRAPSPPAQPSPYGPPQQSVSGETPIPPSATNMAAGLPSAGFAPGQGDAEAQLHTAAQGGEAEAARAEAQAQSAAPADDVNKVKEVIARILMKVKQQAPVLESLQQQAPEAYKAVVGAIQAMLLMAKALMPQEAQAQEQAQGQEQEQGEDTKKSEEPLMKMAVIHDDHTRPMQLWRIQNAAGIGPYGTDLNEDERDTVMHWLNPHFSKLRVRFGEIPAGKNVRPESLNSMKAMFHAHAGEMLPKQPTPSSEFSDEELRHLKQKKGYKFAFTRPEDAERWFGKEVLDKLSSVGYSLSPVLARRAWRGSRSGQVFYKPWGGWPTQERPEPVVFTQKAERALRYKELMEEEPLLKSTKKERERARRALHAVFLNDSVSPELYEEAFQRFLANRGEYDTKMSKDAMEHPHVTRDHATRLAFENLKLRVADKDGDDTFQRELKDLAHKVDFDKLLNMAKEHDAQFPSEDGRPKHTWELYDYAFPGSLGRQKTNRTPIPPSMFQAAWEDKKYNERHAWARQHMLASAHVPPPIVEAAMAMPAFRKHAFHHPKLSPESFAKYLAKDMKALKKVKEKQERNGGWETESERAAIIRNLTAAGYSPHLTPQEAESLWTDIMGTPMDSSDRRAHVRDFDQRHTSSGHKLLEVRVGSQPLRILRDQIEAAGGQLHIAEIQKDPRFQGLNLNDARVMAELTPEQLAKIPEKHRPPPGKKKRTDFVSAEGVQKLIDALPVTRVWASENRWSGGQQHSDEPSNVLRLSFTNDHTEQLLRHGISPREGYSSGHPGDAISGIGWIRWTGSHKKGVHIDENQNDFPKENHDIIDRVLGAPMNQIMHEAFHEWIRQGGAKRNPKDKLAPQIGTPVHIWQTKEKAERSGLDMSEELPLHFHRTYQETPEKMGYKPAVYGQLKTQSNKDNKGANTYAEQFRKSVKEIREAALAKAYTTNVPREPKTTGIDNAVKATGDDFDISEKNEPNPEDAPRPESRLQKIRKGALRKKATGDAVTAAPDGMHVEAGVRKALPMPEEANKSPRKPAGHLTIRPEGKGSSPQIHMEPHVKPGEAAHISMDGKLTGSLVPRQAQAGRVLPQNPAESLSGRTHINGNSSLDPEDGHPKEGNQ